MIGMLLNVVHFQVHKNISTRESDVFHNHSTLLTMLKGSFEVVHRFVDRSTCFTWMDLNHIINSWMKKAIDICCVGSGVNYHSLLLVNCHDITELHGWILHQTGMKRPLKWHHQPEKKIKGLLESLVKVKLRTVDHFIVVDETYHNICRWWKQKWRRCRDREVLCV